MLDLEKIYDKAHFEWYVPLREDYFKIADWLRLNLAPTAVLDLGCGNGFFIDRLLSDKIRILGIEGSAASLPFLNKRLIPGGVAILDVSLPLFFPFNSDLLICVEVAEHLPSQAADTLMNNIYNHASRWVFFSAATPGQGGHHHLNEQPHEYWIEKFKVRGFELQADLTKQLREFAATTKLSWIRDNGMILKKSE